MRGASEVSEPTVLAEFMLRCWSDNENADSVSSTASAVDVRFGVSLFNYLQDVGDGAADLLLGISDDWRMGPRPITQSIYARAWGTSSEPLDDEDWGLDLQGVPHLRLMDSIISSMPLSSAGPLLQCYLCAYLTTQNVTLRELKRSPSRELPAYGAFRFTGLLGATLDNFKCSDVHGAAGWACSLLQAREDASITIRNSVFVNNYVQPYLELSPPMELSILPPIRLLPSAFFFRPPPVAIPRAPMPPPSMPPFPYYPPPPPPPPRDPYYGYGLNAFQSPMQLRTVFPHLLECSRNPSYDLLGAHHGHGAVLIDLHMSREYCSLTFPVDVEASVSFVNTIIRGNTGGCGAGVAVEGPFSIGGVRLISSSANAVDFQY